VLADRYRGLPGTRPTCVTSMFASVSYVCVSVCGGEGGRKGLIEQVRCKYSGGKHQMWVHDECACTTSGRVSRMSLHDSKMYITNDLCMPYHSEPPVHCNTWRACCACCSVGLSDVSSHTCECARECVCMGGSECVQSAESSECPAPADVFVFRTFSSSGR